MKKNEKHINVSHNQVNSTSYPQWDGK